MNLLHCGPLKTWESPETLSFNRLPARATLFPYPTVAAARANVREKSPWWRSLDGEWDFRLVARPEEVPLDFVTPAFAPSTDGDWSKLPVPSNWTMHGHDRPHYTNIIMPFSEQPPRVPQQNPTGLYRTQFTVPADWNGRRTILHVGGAESVLYVWVDGQPVGLAKDTRLPSEFDLTPCVRAGETHTLAAVVVKWSDASFVEDQDQWWMGGIHREVFLYSQRDFYLEDVFARGDVDTDLRKGRFKASVRIGAPDDRAKGCAVRVQLFDANGRSVLKLENRPSEKDFWLAPRKIVDFDAPVRRPQLWSAESPTLYTVVVTLVGPDGGEIEHTSCRIGFRRVEVRDRQLLVNGQPIRITGVNRHEHDDVRGKALTREGMLKDVLTMKRFNVNAVRTSHYPDDAYWYDLCDEYGLYVFDEADIEAHAYYHELARDTRYAPSFLDRGLRMVERDKNHPSIIAWSLGNESGYGPHHDAIAGWIRHRDPSRVIHYEGAITFDWKGGRPATDIVCPMYPQIEKMTTWAKSKPEGDPRPLIMCEFSHAMGNSNGSLADYFDAFDAHRGLQGGFIWEWVDHGIKQRTADGKEYWAYGGDFGDTPNDRNFVCDGLVWPDRTPHPGLFEYKHLAQPVRVTVAHAKSGKFKITNRRWFASLADLRGEWQLLVNGKAVKSGKLARLTAAAQSSQIVTLAWPKLALHAGDEVHVTFRFFAANRTKWCDAGHEVAWEQLAIPASMLGRPVNAPAIVKVKSAASAEVDGDGWTVRAGDLEFRVEKSAGVISHVRSNGTELIARGPQLNVWRSATDNDGLKLFDVVNWGGCRTLTNWLQVGYDRLALEKTTTTCAVRGGKVFVEIDQRWLAPGAKLPITHRHQYVVDGSGAIAVENRFAVDRKLPELPRLGVALVLPAELEQFAWFGRGPWENYRDRNRSTVAEVFRSTVADQYVPYVVPQECGNHTDVRWVELTDARKHGVHFAAAGRMEASALHFTAHDLYQAKHTFDLTPCPEVHLNLDYAQRGLGTASCGPDTLERYRIKPGAVRFGFAITAVG